MATMNEPEYVPCAECGWLPPPPPRNAPPGQAVRQLGVTHYADCPTVQFMTPSQKRALIDHLEEMNRARRRASAEAATFWIG